MHNMLCFFFFQTLVNCVWETEPKGWLFSFYCCFQLLFSNILNDESQGPSLLSIFNKTSSSTWFKESCSNYKQILQRVASHVNKIMLLLCLWPSSTSSVLQSLLFKTQLFLQFVPVSTGNLHTKAPFWPQNSNISAPSPETHWGLFINYKLCQQARWGTRFKLAAEVLRGEKLVMIISLMESDRWIHCVKCSSQRRVKSL